MCVRACVRARVRACESPCLLTYCICIVQINDKILPKRLIKCSAINNLSLLMDDIIRSWLVIQKYV